MPASDPDPDPAPVTRPPSVTAVGLAALICAAMVSSINLGAANIALVRIGAGLHASQADLTHVGAAAILGMASCVLYFGRLSQRYGRSRVIRIGLALSIPLSLTAAFAPSIGWLIAARIAIGVVGAMIYPNTLATIIAVTIPERRHRAIGLWFGCSVGAAAIGPVIAGVLMHWFWWGSTFLVSVPLCVIALALSFRLPDRAGEDRQPIDHASGWLSMFAIAILVSALSLGGTPVPIGIGAGAGLAAILATAIFVHRQRTHRHPLFDLRVAARPSFWLAAVAGTALVGSMLAAFFLGQQFLQHILGYSTTAAGLAVLPTGVAIILVSPRAAVLGARVGGRTMLLAGTATTLVGLGFMLAWSATGSYLPVGAAYLALGCGVGLVGPTVSRALMASVPRHLLAMGSATSDLQSCLGGALLVAFQGSLLALGYRHGFDVASLPPALAAGDVIDQATRSLSGAEQVAATLPPKMAGTLLAHASDAFIEGFHRALWSGAAVLLAMAAIVWAVFPSRARQQALEATYAED